MLEFGKLAWGDVGPAALVVIVVVLIYTGRLVSRAVYEDMKEQRDMFRQAWNESIQREREVDARLDANTNALSAVEQALRALQEGDRRT